MGRRPPRWACPCSSADRARAFYTLGRRFDSCRGRHPKGPLTCTDRFRGPCSCIMRALGGPLGIERPPRRWSVRGPDDEPRGFLVGTILDTLTDAAQSIGTCGLILATVAAWLYGLTDGHR